MIERYRKNVYNNSINSQRYKKLRFAFFLVSDCHNVFLLRNAQGTIYTDILELHTLELRKNPNRDNPMNDWIRFFNAESEEELDMLKTKNPGLLEAIKELKQLNITGILREMHEARLKEIRDRKSMIAYERAEARTEGRAEGLAEGLAEGQQRINQLLQLLIRDARTDEIERMIADPQYQEQLLKEYNL